MSGPDTNLSDTSPSKFDFELLVDLRTMRFIDNAIYHEPV